MPGLRGMNAPSGGGKVEARCLAPISTSGDAGAWHPHQVSGRGWTFSERKRTGTSMIRVGP